MMRQIPTRPLPARSLIAAASLLMLAACNLAPAYHIPTLPGGAPPPAAFKSAPGWLPAQPADAVAKGAWWELFNDAPLSALEEKVAVTNQNVAAARAAYLQARALVAQDRAALFPTVSASGGTTRSGSFGSGAITTGTGGNATGGTTTNLTRFTAQASASWDVDLWGRIGNTVRQARDTAQATAGDLANATLSARMELATDYLSLRAVDAQIAIYDQTIAAQKRGLTVTINQYNVGKAARADVDSAEVALVNSQSSRHDLDRQRAIYEDAVAVLAGQNPSTFQLAPATWSANVPDVPGVIPADILQRRPDIAAAERRVAAANAAIGIQRAAFFPDLSLSANLGAGSTALSTLFSAASSFWSYGGTIAETLLDFGARSAKVRQARAAYDAAVATYRQAALTAFQQVEDNLAAQDADRAAAADLHAAEVATARSETIARNQFAAGTIDFTGVASVVGTHDSARIALVQNTLNRQSNVVALIGAIGGAWTGGVDLAPTTPRPPAEAGTPIAP